MTLFAALLRLGLGGILLYAGWAKVQDPTDFAIQITNYRLGDVWAPWAAVALPPIELLTGALLLLAPRRSPWLQAACLVALGMFAVFLAAVITVVLRGIDISCGCFGGDSGPVSWITVARNTLLCTATAALLWYARRGGDSSVTAP
ncbi:MAG: hypothetical protein HY904_20370 [Deltaproteobacteria bacterium]|nr:hypothetical protein [Deltaproteobacteria bacterium]